MGSDALFWYVWRQLQCTHIHKMHKYIFLENLVNKKTVSHTIAQAGLELYGPNWSQNSQQSFCLSSGNGSYCCYCFLHLLLFFLFLLLLLLLFVFETGSLSSHGTCYVDQAGLKLIEIPPCLCLPSAGTEGGATMPDFFLPSFFLSFWGNLILISMVAKLEHSYQ